ncbi:MAG: hypothetical protein L3J10_00740 [Sulfurimonas sp.]|nr:hypothetical protein [Sulfurimonas sp.]
MYKVKVENTCSCFLKSGMADVQEFGNKDDAQKEAENMIGEMRSSFCKKHDFALNEQFGDYTIFIKPRT